MTVIYVPANDGLHAVKAETSEELWNFVPWDQLGKLKDLVIHEQVVNPHTYMVSSSVRVADIFVPGTFTLDGVTYAGRWRTVIVFGRGPGGKYYTALDVTAPGPYTRDHLATNPPWVMWSRGNPDKDINGAAVRAADTTAYSTMGYTWSVPAIGNETATPEWRMYMGSGYSEIPSEGATYYVVDATTGDMVDWRGVGDGTPTYFADNALVAAPALYNSFQMDSPNVAQRSTADYVSRVYIPDVHGRIWKFAAGSGGMFANPGPSQPMTNAVGLLKINDTVHVYAEAGGDNRVTPPPAATPPFNMYGYRDLTGDGNWSIAGTALPGFPIAFSSIFRGTSQPGTAFNDAGNGRVFYIGTRFNTADVSCLSSFDSILYAVGAETGGAAYDFSGDNVADLSTTFTGKKLQGPQMIGGAVVTSEGGSLGSPPPPGTPSSMPTPAPPKPASLSMTAQSSGSAVCRQ
jgi:hypothetical protein